MPGIPAVVDEVGYEKYAVLKENVAMRETMGWSVDPQYRHLWDNDPESMDLVPMRRRIHGVARMAASGLAPDHGDDKKKR